MMNERKPKGQSIFDKRGFYIALYSCIALILVSAVGITYSSLGRAGRESAGITNPAMDYSMAAGDVQEAAENSQTIPIPESGPQADVTPDGQTESEGLTAELGDPTDVIPAASQQEKPLAEEEQTEEVPAVTKEEETAQALTEEEGLTETEDEEAMAVYSNGAEPVEGLTETDGTEEQTAEDESAEVAAEDDSYTESGDEVLADPVFNTFTGNEDMLWPVSGNVVMDFSLDKLVYDQTLNQFRTNDSICIAAEEGTQVVAAADGVVRTVTNSRQYGNEIVVEHGNGWFTTYSQLQDGILVSEGDVVTEGQVIGGVGSPSIYGVLLGSHLSFKVVKDDTPINPNIVLAVN